ncbi:MAG: metallophosphoesterase family protein [bacterium]|nr:metallophosphoesterase family protein [bacterium]
MTRIAIISDIHGNMPALEAVLDDLAGQAVDEVLVGGDLVGRGPAGSKVTKRIRSLGFPAIGGNHEDYLLDFRRGKVPDEWLDADEWSAARWMAAELDDDDVEYLACLPFSIGRPGLRLVHGTPATNREGIGPWTGDDEMSGYWGAVEEPVLVCAHTHRPLLREIEGGLVVNVGSVGLPFNRDRRAQYAIFTSQAGGAWRVEPRQVPYDLEEIFEIYETSGFQAAGGITAQLLRMELEHSTPLLVPFLEWAKVLDVTPTAAQLERFLESFQPGQSLREFFRRLRQSASA